MKHSIVYKNCISKESSANRIDAEFFLPEILYNINLVKKHKYDKLGNLLKVLTDYHANGSYELLKEYVQISKTKNYSLMIRTVDFENDNFEDDVIYISKNAYEFLEKTKLFGYEVIINKIGNAGKTYLMPKLNIPVSLGMNVFMLKFNSIEYNTFVYVYLNTKYGKSIIERRVTGAVPLSIDKESIREVLIPLYSDRLYRLIYLLIEKNFNYNKESKKIFNET
ncbi:MAG: restriction endonuclease subunit S, partial [Muribaculaceae bacterium]|nr:restriction endonuclease subunit S [Muribaculaceae bacterium]